MSGKDQDRKHRVSPLDLLHLRSVEDSVDEFQEHMVRSILFRYKRKMRIFCINKALEAFGDRGLYLEFGVFKGVGLNLFADELRRHGLEIFGFDSLYGLEEDWVGHHQALPAGAFSVDGIMPDLKKNAHLRQGWVQDTLPDFLLQYPNKKIAFAHMDFDTYTPTAFALDCIKPRLEVGSIVLFDELYGYSGWRGHEYKALKEVLSDDQYRYICFSNEAVGIQITKTA